MPAVLAPGMGWGLSTPMGRLAHIMVKNQAVNCVKFSNSDRFCSQNLSTTTSSNCFSFWGTSSLKPYRAVVPVVDVCLQTLWAIAPKWKFLAAPLYAKAQNLYAYNCCRVMQRMCHEHYQFMSMYQHRVTLYYNYMFVHHYDHWMWQTLFLFLTNRPTSF